VGEIEGTGTEGKVEELELIWECGRSGKLRFDIGIDA
jgi:hypothetical protein